MTTSNSNYPRALFCLPVPGWRAHGRLVMGKRRFACRLGHGGRTTNKREGDGATPVGRWPLLEVRYRSDRTARPLTLLPVTPLRPDDGWCDDPADRNYNRPVKRPCPASHENLWRTDHAYDLLVVLDYNFSRRARNRGSAIFLHLDHEDRRPTAGCLAFAEHDLRQILRHCRPGDWLEIRP